ncbi:MAG: quinone-dependent dihydroorotate dehydrogenase [Planctomycetota bacterium]
MLWNLTRPLLFTLPAERAHYFSMGVFNSLLTPRWISNRFRNSYAVNDDALKSTLFGLNFQNPVGLAAGFDKDARWFPALASLGFSHVEVGTITGKAQPGNPKPRLFRLPADKAIINRMGFNNSGADAAAKRLESTRRASDQDILGVNIGKSKVVPVEQATADYLYSFERLFTYADYFTVNVSSPNTPGLRSLQNKEPLIELLTAVMAKNRELARDHATHVKPVLLKIAPDVTDEQLADIIFILREIKLDGIIATNTTLSRESLLTPAATVESIGAGGLSGAPLTTKSRGIVATLYRELKGDVPIIGVGGIMSGEDAWQMILSGASLVQIYTGFIYGGPSIVRDMNQHIVGQLGARGWSNVADAVGQGSS